MIKRKLSRKNIERENFNIWNAFIDILAMEDESKLTEIQKNAQRAFWYEAEVQNGGHVQYFENTNLNDYSPVIKSLNIIGAHDYAILLEKAVKAYFKDGTKNINNAGDFIKEALNEINLALDFEYSKINPDMNHYLKEYLNKYFDEFIEIA